jgi:hypothetical protein
MTVGYARGLAGLVVVGAMVAGAAAPAEAKAKKPKLSKAEKKKLKKAKKRQKKFFKKAAAAYDDELWDDAIASFLLANEALPKAGILFNIARCYENKNDQLKAVEYLEQFVAEEEDEEAKEEGQDVLDVVRKKVAQSYATVNISAKPKGAEVRLTRGETTAVTGAAPFKRYLEPGKWVVTIVKEGFDEWKEERALEPGKVLNLDITLVDPKVREAEEKAAAAKKKKEDAAAKKKAEKERKEAEALAWAREDAEAESFRNWMIVGGGAVLVATGTVTAFLLSGANEKVDDLAKDGGTVADHRSAADAASSLALMTNVLLGAGTAGVIAGGALMYLADDPPAEPATAGPGVLIRFGGHF